MKAVICTKYGLPEVLKIVDLENPVAKDSEVLVKIMVKAVNSGDAQLRALDTSLVQHLMMRVINGFTVPRKKILGTVLSGVVESVGDKVTKFKVGDEVCHDGF